VTEPIPRPTLSVQSVSKSFPGTLALDKVGIDLFAGEAHALVGENGAGKSTLIKVMTGVYSRDEGELTYLGEPVVFTEPSSAWAAGISTTYQEINLVPSMSVARNLHLGREPRTKTRLVDLKAMNAAARNLLEAYGIDIDPRRTVGSLGPGVQQMIAIVRAVSAEGRVVIMDEPTSSLEPREVDHLFEIIDRLKGSGVAILYVSHNLDEIFRICERVTILRDGQRVHTGLTKDTGKLEVIASMLGRDLAGIRRGHITDFSDESHSTAALILDARSLRRRHVLDDVDVAVHQGEVVGLAGLLGSGRTETVSAIFGLQPLDDGEVEVDGARLKRGSPRAAIAAGLGLLPEDRKAEGIVPTMSVRDNVVLAALPKVSRFGFVVPRRVERLVERLATALDIKMSSAGQSIADLSGGNQQKTLIARMLCIDPKVLLLDEPTRGIDVGAKAEVQRMIEEMAADGLGIVLISSELEDIVEGADRVLVLKNGSVIGSLDGPDVDEHAIMNLIAAGGTQEEGAGDDE
jgi:ribose transport system ATP-binding protein